MIKGSFLIWLLIIPLAILNGELRERILDPLMDEKYSLPLSGVLLCLLIFFVCYIYILHIGKGTAKQYWTIGLLWLLLTIVFEIVLGFLSGYTLSGSLKAYDVTTGNLWLLVVLFTGIAPWLSAKTRKLI